ncbi:MAG TPA: hypothetical protein VFQ91_01335 [Bryobacteraceae bacterium]|nr:hypothetical protein [Bryobacteraceae bacterium]
MRRILQQIAGLAQAVPGGPYARVAAGIFMLLLSAGVLLADTRWMMCLCFASMGLLLLFCGAPALLEAADIAEDDG